MKTKRMFEIVREGGYSKTWAGADWKIVDGIMFFQASHGKLDWFFNFVSALRIPARLSGQWFLFPFGAWILWRSLSGVIKKHEVRAYVGYSQGGWFASYASAKTARPAYTFGCPKLGKGKAYLFFNVTHLKNKGDIVTMVPPWAETYGRVNILEGEASKPEGMNDLEWATGHTPEEYAQRIT